MFLLCFERGDMMLHIDGYGMDSGSSVSWATSIAVGLTELNVPRRPALENQKGHLHRCQGQSRSDAGRRGNQFENERLQSKTGLEVGL